MGALNTWLSACSPLTGHTLRPLVHLKSIWSTSEHPSPSLSYIYPAAQNKNSLFKTLPRQCQHIRSTEAEAEQAHPHWHIITSQSLGRVSCCSLVSPHLNSGTIYPDDPDTHVEWKFPKKKKRKRNSQQLSWFILTTTGLHPLDSIHAWTAHCRSCHSIIPGNNGGFLFSPHAL